MYIHVAKLSCLTGNTLLLTAFEVIRYVHCTLCYTYIVVHVSMLVYVHAYIKACTGVFGLHVYLHAIRDLHMHVCIQSHMHTCSQEQECISLQGLELTFCGN